jgi:hypothetical protein
VRTMKETERWVDYARGNVLCGRHDIVSRRFGRVSGLIVIPSIAVAGLRQVAFGELSVQGQPLEHRTEWQIQEVSV